MASPRSAPEGRESAVDAQDRGEGAPALARSRVIVSGKNGGLHPVLYAADASGKFVQVPLVDSAVAFLLTVSG